MELCKGFSTFSGRDKNQVVQPIGPIPGSSTNSQLKISVVTSMEDFQSSLEIDASMKVSYSVFSVEAKARYLHELNFTTNSIAIVIYSNHYETTDRPNVEIPEAVLKTLDTPAGVNDFVRQYGDCWCSKITKGGEFYATFTFYSETRHEKEEVEASLKANGVVGGVSVDMSLATKISRVLDTSKVSYKIDKAISGYGSLVPPKYTTPDEYTLALIQFADSLSGVKPENPATISFGLEPYEELLPFAVNFEKVTDNRASFNGNPARQGWGEMVAQLLTAMNACNGYKKVYKFYNSYVDELLNLRLAQIKKDMDYLYRFIEKVNGKPNSDFTFEEPASVAYGLPTLNYSVLVPTPGTFLNGAGGTPYQDVNMSTVSQFIHLYSIQISKGDIVDMLTAKYATKIPLLTPGTGDAGQRHGTSGGTVLPEWFLGEEEFIIAMYGKMGNRLGHSVLSVLFFRSNKGNVYKTSENAETEADQKWDAKPGEALIGFSGSSGNNLDCIQPMVVRFLPASWDGNVLRVLS